MYESKGRRNIHERKDRLLWWVLGFILTVISDSLDFKFKFAGNQISSSKLSADASKKPIYDITNIWL